MELSRKLVLEARQRVGDGAGGYIETWMPLGSLWAAIKPGSGRETADAGGALSRVPITITVRAAPIGSSMRPHAGHRFVEGTRIYEIASVSEAAGTAQYLICRATEEMVT